MHCPPLTTPTDEVVSLEDLATIFAGSSDVLLALHEAARLGLVGPGDDGRYWVTSAPALRLGIALAATGIPLAAAFEEAYACLWDTQRLATRFVDMISECIRVPPAVDDVPSLQPPPDLTDLVGRLRPLWSASVQSFLGRALEKATADALDLGSAPMGR